MSWETQSWAAKQRPGSASAKLVLLGLASCADQNHCAFPSVQWLCDFSDLNRKTVISALQRLEDGMFPLIADTGERRGRTGQVKVYRLSVLERPNNGVILDQDPASLPAEETVPKVEQFQKRNSSVSGSKQSQKRDTEPFREPKPPLSPNGDNTPKPEKSIRSKGDKFVLPADWQAPDLDTLPPEAVTLVRQWPSGAYAVQCASFRNHWSEIDRRKRTESGWLATLANWLGRVHPEVMRAKKAGVSFEQIPADAHIETKPVRPVKAKEREDAQSVAIHGALALRLGQSIYGQWFAPVAVIVERHKGTLSVVAPSDFASSWIDQHYRGALIGAAAAAGLEVHKIKFETETKGSACP